MLRLRRADPLRRRALLRLLRRWVDLMTEALFDVAEGLEAIAPHVINYLLHADDPAERVDRMNALRRLIAEHSPFKDEPVDFVEWVPAESVHANDYNPNSVAPPEMELLRLSITSDGYTQPIVTMPDAEDGREVIDGFHRNRVGKECPDVRERVNGYLPVVTIREDRTGKNDRIAATIRHNRARGKHRVDAMSDIVIELKRRNWSEQRIAKELGMEPDEVLRLCQISGIAELFSDDEFSAAWDIEGVVDEDEVTINDELAGPLGGNGPDGIPRIFHTWDEWECYPAGFYDDKPKDSALSDDACTELYAELLRDIPAFEAAMSGVLRDWPNSCEHYLSNERMNRIAWLGQSALCYTHGIPRRFRSGYMLLTDPEKLAANTAALKYLNVWLEGNGHETLATLEDAASRTEMDLY